MATSTQRIAIMVFLLDILVISLIPMWIGNNTNYSDELTNYGDSYETWVKEYTTNFGNTTVDSNANYLDKQFGDVKYGGNMIFKLLKVGIPDGTNCSESDCSLDYLYWLHWATTTAFIILNIILGIEAYSFFVNRKTP